MRFVKAPSASLAVMLSLASVSFSQSPGRVESGYVTASDGARLFYQKVGSGKQLVIIPLGFMLFDDFKRLARGRTLIFYDMRNRGRSDPLTDDSRISIQHDVEDLESVRRHFGADRVSLIGESYLGMMVVLYAIRHPQRIDRIVQIGPVPIKFGTRYPPRLTGEDPDSVFDKEEVQKLRKLREDGYHRTNPKSYCEKEWLVTRVGLVGNPENAARVGRGYCDYPNEWPINLARHFGAHFTSVQKLDIRREDIKTVSNPVLTIHGSRDRNAPYGGGREWALELPNARLVTVKGAAHFPWLDAPDLVFSSIDAFLKGGWPAPAERVTAIDGAAESK